MVWTGCKQFIDRLHPRNDFPCSIPLIEHAYCHVFNRPRVEPAFGAIRHPGLRTTGLQLPGNLARTLAIQFAGGQFGDAIKVVEVNVNAARRENCTRMQVVFQAPFLGKNGLASRSLINCFGGMLTEFRFRR